MNILFLTSAAPKHAGFSTSEKRPPLGLGFLMSILDNRKHKIFFSDEYLKTSNILCSNFLEKNNIDFVGIYSNTICYSSTLNMLNILEKKRDKGLWTGKIIIGGPHTSVGYDDIPDYVDYIVIGEGEKTIIDIIENGVKSRIIKGEKVKDLDSIPFTSWNQFIFRPYLWTHHGLKNTYPIYTMNTSRGCPFDCQFCSVKSIWGKTYRYMSAERIIEEIKHLIKFYGAQGIYFREDHFTLNRKRTIEFCELLLRENISIKWLCETRVESLDDYELQKLMYKAGCRFFYIGVESGSQRMLDFYQKGETVEQFIKAFDIAKKAGIKSYASFIVGFPSETPEDIKLTETLIKRLSPDFVGRNIFVGIPGSELYNYILNNNLYDYIDQNKIIYPKNYLSNVYKYYNDNNYYRVYENKKSSRINLFLSKLAYKINKYI